MVAPASRRSLERLALRAALALTLPLLVLGFATVSASHGAPFALHTALAAVLLPALVVHMVVRWHWITRTLRRFVAAARARDRVRLVVDLLLGLGFAALLVSGVGLWITGARSALVDVASDALLLTHHAVAKPVMLLLAVHLVLNRRWLVTQAIGRKR